MKGKKNWKRIIYKTAGERNSRKCSVMNDAMMTLEHVTSYRTVSKIAVTEWRFRNQPIITRETKVWNCPHSIFTLNQFALSTQIILDGANINPFHGSVYLFIFCFIFHRLSESVCRLKNKIKADKQNQFTNYYRAWSKLFFPVYEGSMKDAKI